MDYFLIIIKMECVVKLYYYITINVNLVMLILNLMLYLFSEATILAYLYYLL